MSETKQIEPVQNATKVERPTQVYKEMEFKQMIELVNAGIWRNTNLARALGIDSETVARYKRQPEIQEAYRNTVLKFAKRRTDVEMILKELDVESNPNTSELTIKVIPLLGGASAHAIPSNTSDAQIVEANETD